MAGCNFGEFLEEKVKRGRKNERKTKGREKAKLQGSNWWMGNYIWRSQADKGRIINEKERGGQKAEKTMRVGQVWEHHGDPGEEAGNRGPDTRLHSRLATAAFA